MELEDAEASGTLKMREWQNTGAITYGKPSKQKTENRKLLS